MSTMEDVRQIEKGIINKVTYQAPPLGKFSQDDLYNPKTFRSVETIVEIKTESKVVRFAFGSYLPLTENSACELFYVEDEKGRIYERLKSDGHILIL